MKDELKEQMDACSHEIGEIELKLETLAPLDKMKSYLTMYALIRACGTIEYVFKAIVADYFDISPISQVQTYIDKTVREASTSAKYGNMCDLLGKFDSSWQRSFKEAIRADSNGNRLISSVESLVTNRHQFAHGRTPTATFNDIKQYYLDSIELIKHFDTVVR